MIKDFHKVSCRKMRAWPIRNTTVQTLNDRFGIQCRGGCSCVGTDAEIDYLIEATDTVSCPYGRQRNL